MDHDLDDVDEFMQECAENGWHIEKDGMSFCFACGMLAQPGDEEYDWCDHRTGEGCAYMVDDDDDDDYDEWEGLED